MQLFEQFVLAVGDLHVSEQPHHLFDLGFRQFGALLDDLIQEAHPPVSTEHESGRSPGCDASVLYCLLRLSRRSLVKSLITSRIASCTRGSVACQAKSLGLKSDQSDSTAEARKSAWTMKVNRLASSVLPSTIFSWSEARHPHCPTRRPVHPPSDAVLLRRAIRPLAIDHHDMNVTMLRHTNVELRQAWAGNVTERDPDTIH